MSEPDDDVGARDAWLSQALRHAPDADAVPPSAVSAAILAEARAAIARPTSSSPRGAPARGGTFADTLRACWDALARPPVAAAFASVMAATIVGLMWWDRPMDDTLPRPPSTAAERKIAAPPEPSAPASLNTPAPAAASADPQGAATSVRVAPAETARKREAPAAFPSQETAQAKQREGSRPRVDEAKKDAAPSLAGQGAATPARQAQNATATGSLSAAAAAATSVPVEPAAAASPAPAPVVAAAPAARPAPAPTSPLDAGRAVGASRSEASADRAEQPVAKSIAPGRAPVPSADPATRRRGDTDRRDSTDALERDKAAAAPEAFARRDTPDLRRERAVAATSPLTPLRDAIARDPQRWTRQSAAGAEIALDPAWRDWLAEIDAAAAGRWQATTAQALEDERRDGAVLRLFVDGRAAAVLRLDGQAVQVDTFLGTVPERGRATLAPGVAGRLTAGRARLSP